MTWFRADERIHWLQVDPATNWEALAEEIVKLFLDRRRKT
jgi:hypothetical protein